MKNLTTKTNKKSLRVDKKVKKTFKAIEEEKSEDEEDKTPTVLKVNPEIKVKKKFGFNIFDKKKGTKTVANKVDFYSMKSGIIDTSPAAYQDIESFTPHSVKNINHEIQSD